MHLHVAALLFTVARTPSQWTPAPSLPSLDMGMQGGISGNELWIAGGYDGKSISDKVMSFSVANGWKVRGHTPGKGVGSDDSGSAVLNGKLYLVGGISAASGSVGTRMHAYGCAEIMSLLTIFRTMMIVHCI